MTLRKVKFGQITLETNGFNRALYDDYFDERNLPLNGEHPENWHTGKLREIVQSVGRPLDDLPKATIEAIAAESRTRLSKEDIERASSEAMPIQLGIDEELSYEESRGFFEDFLNAFRYADQLRSVGFNPWSKRVHSDLVVIGKGETSIKSKQGREYELKPYIFISGNHHNHSFYLNLQMPFDYRKEGESKRLHDFVLNSEGLIATPSHMLVSHNGGPYQEEVSHYVLSVEGIEAFGSITKYPEIFTEIGLFGTLKYFEPFCQAVVDKLDEHFDGQERQKN
ncbi:MAG: hypothetical protein ABIH72_00690 [archaeon]